MKLPKILFASVFSILLIAVISALPVSYGEWSNQANTITITNGSSASFNYYFHTSSSPMSMNIKLYDSSGNLVYTFLDTTTSNTYYYNNAPVLIGSSTYKNPGIYTLTFYSNDASNKPSAMSITLVVNPIIGNATPTINSIPNQAVNESTSYTYQVSASDADSDALSYSLPTNPLGFSINSTGWISGTIPAVSADTNYSITVQVSDGLNLATQNYILTVKNIVSPPTQNQTLSIQFVSPTPASGSVLAQDSIPVEISITNSSQINNITISLYDASGNLIRTALASPLQLISFDYLSPATYKINATVTDNLGNSSSTETRTINLQSGNPNYNYNDVYQNYQQNPNPTNPATGTITKTNPAFSFTFAILLFEILFILVLAGIIIFIIAKRRYQ